MPIKHCWILTFPCLGWLHILELVTSLYNIYIFRESDPVTIINANQLTVLKFEFARWDHWVCCWVYWTIVTHYSQLILLSSSLSPSILFPLAWSRCGSRLSGFTTYLHLYTNCGQTESIVNRVKFLSGHLTTSVTHFNWFFLKLHFTLTLEAPYKSLSF